MTPKYKPGNLIYYDYVSNINKIYRIRAICNIANRDNLDTTITSNLHYFLDMLDDKYQIKLSCYSSIERLDKEAKLLPNAIQILYGGL